MWFDEIAAVDNPEVNELLGFTRGTIEFLEFSLKEEKLFIPLWKENNKLRGMASHTFEKDVLGSVRNLNEQIKELVKSEFDPYFKNRLIEHGLIGSAMRFKIAVLDYIANTWEEFKSGIRRELNIRAWLKQMFDAIDAILDSLVEATGAGHLIKEFKDALSALATAK